MLPSTEHWGVGSLSFPIIAAHLDKALTELWAEVELLDAEEKLDSKQTQRLRRLKNLLKDYRSNFPIPRNLVLLGTLNADETTYDLSPKVIDRSFVITYPPADLTGEGVSEPVAPKSING